MLLFPVCLPDYALQIVPSNLFYFSQVSYLLLVDAYSKRPCVAQIKPITSAALICEVTHFFCDFGSPVEMEFAIMQCKVPRVLPYCWYSPGHVQP